MITIIDYNAGNIASLQNALEKLGVPYVTSSDPKVIAKADKVLFPGQGHIGQAMRNLEEKGLVKVINNLKQPFLGICVGAQLLFEFSEEGNTSGLGIVPGIVKRFPKDLKVPQIGWNVTQSVIARSRRRAALDDVATKQSRIYYYFVHSYYLPINEFTVATTDYGITFASIVKRNNFTGVQFHPEKSGEAGLAFLKHFLHSS